MLRIVADVDWRSGADAEVGERLALDPLERSRIARRCAVGQHADSTNKRTSRRTGREADEVASLDGVLPDLAVRSLLDQQQASPADDVESLLVHFVPMQGRSQLPGARLTQVRADLLEPSCATCQPQLVSLPVHGATERSSLLSPSEAVIRVFLLSTACNRVSQDRFEHLKAQRPLATAARIVLMT